MNGLDYWVASSSRVRSLYHDVSFKITSNYGVPLSFQQSTSSNFLTKACGVTYSFVASIIYGQNNDMNQNRHSFEFSGRANSFLIISLRKTLQRKGRLTSLTNERAKITQLQSERDHSAVFIVNALTSLFESRTITLGWLAGPLTSPDSVLSGSFRYSAASSSMNKC